LPNNARAGIVIHAACGVGPIPERVQDGG